MSRTDHHRPYWVQVHDADLPRYVMHTCDGRECRVGDIYDDERRHHRRGFLGHHHRRCAKRVVIEYSCTKRNPERARYYRWPLNRDRDSCWTSWLETIQHDDGSYGFVRHRNQCLGHRRVEWHPEVSCVCDDYPAEPTCWAYTVWGATGPRYHFGRGPNREERAVYYHRPERRRERDSLREAAKLHRAGELDEDFDFVNRQARGSVLYDVW